mmetsp:Transcript_27920/g.48270  ORF Transcript_27920/g.48270 Transcript_27920/m.48270 type:complete len:612 (-) Transcript_27920:8-1843(-)
MEQFNNPGNDEDAADINVQTNFLMQVRRQIEGNDPDLVKLEIYPHYYVGRGNDWERDGKSIGENTRIKELIISGLEIYPDFDVCNGMMKQDLEKFFSGVAHNRSIQKLSFCQCNLFDGEIFRILVPFFKENRNFECLQMEGCDVSPECLHLITTALAKFDSLKEIIIFREFESEIDEIRAGELVRVLTGHSDLRKISMVNVPIGRNGCATLATFLQNPKSKLAVLKLHYNNIEDEGAAVLATGLSGNSTLNDLEISKNEDIAEAGWRAIFSTLQSPNCALEKLNLSRNKFEDEVIGSLADALTNNSSLRSVNLSDDHAISMNGWGAIFSALQSPVCAVEKLDLHYNSINDEVAISLANDLTSNTALKSLNLMGTGINDETVIFLANALANNTRLMELDLRSNDDVTVTGWQSFSTVLQSPTSALETLNLCLNSINDATMISLADSLANNNKLKELLTSSIMSNINSNNCWAAFSRVVCNTSSIMDTYHSNHTLQKLSEVFEDLRSLLLINRGNSKSAAARLKIIKTHFREGFTVHPFFVDMELKVLPHAIAWMGRGGISHELNGHVYGFLRSMPSLFDVDRKIKKREDALLFDVDSLNRKRKMEDQALGGC